MAVVLIHPTGNQNVRSVLAALHGRGLLSVFATTLGHSAEEKPPRWLGARWREEWRRRSYPIPSELVWQRPAYELARLGAQRLGLKSLTRHETGHFSVDSVYRRLDSQVAAELDLMIARRNVQAVYGYEDGCLETFRQANMEGLRCCYDLPIAYWEMARRLLDEEAARLPAWRPTLLGVTDSGRKLERKTEELTLADTVFCPSAFVADSLPAWAQEEKRVVVAPFGSPGAWPYEREPRMDKRAKLRVLFAGRMTQRKGLADLFAAIEELGRDAVELVVMGSLLAPISFYRDQCASFVYEPPRRHADVLRLMRSCDVFVLPSIVEGRALVVLEAMSQGLPVIITPNTGNDDVVEPGRTGFLVPIRSSRAIAERLAWFVDHREDTREMGRLAQEKARTCTWGRYGTTVADSVEGLFVS